MRAILRESLVADGAALIAKPSYENILHRAAFLPAEDRQLLESVLGQGISAAQVARLSGQPIQRARYRVRKLCKHLSSKRFTRSMRALRILNATQRQVVTRHILQGRPIREVAAATGLTLHEVRKQLLISQGIIDRAAHRRASLTAELVR